MGAQVIRFTITLVLATLAISVMDSLGQASAQDEPLLPAPRVFADDDVPPPEMPVVSDFYKLPKLTATRKVHALLVIDTDATDGRGKPFEGFSVSRTTIEVLLDQIGIVPTVFAGKGVRPTSIVEYFRSLPEDPDAVLFFYYIGHGATQPADGREHVGPANQHVFSLNNGRNTIWRKTVRDAMLSRSPRLAVLMSDCCSKLSVVYAPWPQAAPVQGGVTGGARVMLDLLCHHTGLVDITSSSFDPNKELDEYSLCDPLMGGLWASCLSDVVWGFTVSDKDGESFDKNGDGFAHWREIFTATSAAVTRIAANRGNPQHPQCFTMARRDSERNRRSSPRPPSRRASRKPPNQIGIHAIYKNSLIRAKLEGNTGRLCYRCRGCEKWHLTGLEFVRRGTLDPAGFRGVIYKVGGFKLWYFFSTEGFANDSGLPPYFPWFRSESSSTRGFIRRRVPGGTTREALLPVQGGAQALAAPGEIAPAEKGARPLDDGDGELNEAAVPE